MQSQTAGFVLVEAVVAAAVCTTVLAGAIGAFLITVQNAQSNSAQVQASYLAEEGVEAMRVIRDTSWSSNISSLTSNTTYYLSWNGTTWVSTTTNKFIDRTFERKVVLSDVNRDNSSKDIVTSGGTTDPNTKKVTVTVSWRNGASTTSKSLSAYLANIFSN